MTSKNWFEDYGITDPYYADKWRVIVKGDCVKVMADLPSESVDLTVTSPPYDNLRNYNGYSFDFDSIAQGLYHLTKQGGVVVWVVGDATIKGSETGTSFKQALYFKELGFNLHDTMIYRKSNPGGARGSIYAYWQCFEFMFVFSKGKLSTFSPIEDRKNLDYRTGRQGGRRNKLGGVDVGRVITTKPLGRRLNIWDYSTTVTDPIVVGHPAPFPEGLAVDHIVSWSRDDAIVLDPMCGSGTTLKMAGQLNRKCIGIEISEEYCEIAANRCATDTIARIQRGEY